jgi:electron transfer flavoprotein alpha subunit
MTMPEILVYSDKLDAARELVFKGREFAGQLGLGLSAVALGDGAISAASELGAHGADKVFVSEDAALDGLQTDVVAEALAQIASQVGAEYILVASTRRGKELAGRLAQKLGAGAVTDVNTMAVKDGALVGGRYALGGNTVAEERIESSVKVFAVMPKTFEVGEPQAGAGEVVAAALALNPSVVRVVGRRPKEGEAVNLDVAPRIIGVGRGFGKREDLGMAQQLAAALEAEIACTKSIADFEWLPEERIVGLSGAKTKPDFYLAIGISGQIQHTVGISQSKLIAAVNTDKDAPIFQLADYGLVGDLYQIVPALVEKLKSL